MSNYYIGPLWDQMTAEANAKADEFGFAPGSDAPNPHDARAAQPIVARNPL